MKEKIISIIIPAYNEELYLEKTLLSIKIQSYKNIEIIVVDDGSTDKTIKIARKYAKVIRLKKKKGVSYARNLGAIYSRGWLLIFLDADTIFQNKEGIKEIVRYTKSFDYGTCRMKAEKLNGFFYAFLKNLFIRYNLLPASNGIIFIKKSIHNKICFNEKKDKGEIFEYFTKAKEYGKFGFVNAFVIPSMRRGLIKTTLYWMGIKIGLFKKHPYPIIR